MRRSALEDRQPVLTAVPRRSFPPSFAWGAGSAAYQIEGNGDVHGRSPSIWDTFRRDTGGPHARPAVDHYHRFRGDVALMRSLGLTSYRFSASWSRVRPAAGPVNQRGLDFYRRLTDALLEAGITPWITLYHWDLPQALEDQGGWTSRDTAYRFLDYALTMYDALGDRIPLWTTLHEPWRSAFLGYTGGLHAPGRRDGVAGVVAAHHLLLGHGLAVQELRRRGAGPQRDRHLGITLNLSPAAPADPADPADPAEPAAARHTDGLVNRLFLDPLLRGRYADDLAAATAGLTFRGRAWQEWVLDGDRALIGQPLDLLGVCYDPAPVTEALRHPDPAHPDPAQTTGRRPAGPAGGAMATGLTGLLLRLRDEYDAPPLYVSDGAAAYDDAIEADSTIDDRFRLESMREHLIAIHDALEAAVDVRGYVARSFLDGSVPAYGDAPGSGLVHVDPLTGVRTPKASARWYAGVAATGRI